MNNKIGVGDEVICVNDLRPDGWNIEHFPQWVAKDTKYIVREFLDNDNIVVGVLLMELRNPSFFNKLINREQEGAFAIWRFQKLRSAYAIEEEKASEKRSATKKISVRESVELN
jgi:hypothetical protein